MKRLQQAGRSHYYFADRSWWRLATLLMTRHTGRQLYLRNRPFVKSSEAPALKLLKTLEVAMMVTSIKVKLFREEARAA